MTEVLLLLGMPKCFLMMALMLGHEELYRVIKLHEVGKVVLNNLAFLASSLVSFLMSENCFFHFTWLVIPSS